MGDGEELYIDDSINEIEIKRQKIAFFDYPDVFEDFYSHYGVTQQLFATHWSNTANHQWIQLIQENIGDVVWYVNCIKKEHSESIHSVVGCKVTFVQSNLFHKILWKLFYLPSFSWRWRRFYRSFAFIASFLSPLSLSLWKKLKEHNPDVILVQDYCSGRYDVLLFFAYLLKIPLLTFHSGSTPDKYLGKNIRKFTLKKASWIFPSGENEQRILKNKFNYKIEQTSIIRPPIDIHSYKPIDRDDACEKLKLDPNRRYILFVGRLQDSVKRLSTIIKVFSTVAKTHLDVDLLIVGSGVDEVSLKNYAKEIAPNRIYFIGWIAEDHTKALYYNVSECLVLNSWREASPAVIGEAFSCGIPVLSSNVGGIDDLVIQDVTGWLFPAGNDTLFKETLLKLIKHPDKIKNMRKKIREVAIKKVSQEEILKSLKKGFYHALYKNDPIAS